MSGFGDDNMNAQPAEVQPAAPGWYPGPTGQQQYWDGVNWAAPAAGGGAAFAGAPSGGQVVNGVTSDERTMSLIAHVGAIFSGFIAPLIVWALKKDESAFVKHHATEALNFQLTLLIGWLIVFVLSFVLIGLLLLPVLLILQILFPVLAAMKANNGEGYNYPLSIKMVS